MSKVTIVQVIYNNKKWIEPVFNAIFNQTYKNFNVVAVISESVDGSKELLMQKFPQVEIVDPGYNIGFAVGHNIIFNKYINPESNLFEPTDFFQLVNPDMIMEPQYIEQMVKAFEDEKVGAATGKLYKIANSNQQSAISSEQKILDTTGVTIAKSGRARDRGQHEVDKGQYDSLINVDAVSGAGCMYRAKALQATSYKLQAFDEDFHSYWEDVDLSWRMKNKGWKNVFVPTAIGYHGRGAGSSKGGYLHIIDFIKHHRALSPRIRQLNYRNHILMYLKNSKFLYPQFFIREFFMFWYILFFETSTFKVLPELFKLIPKAWKKRV